MLGFTLDEVRSLLGLQDGRNRRAIQSVAQARLGQIEDKIPLAPWIVLPPRVAWLARRCLRGGFAHDDGSR